MRTCTRKTTVTFRRPVEPNLDEMMGPTAHLVVRRDRPWKTEGPALQTVPAGTRKIGGCALAGWPGTVERRTG